MQHSILRTFLLFLLTVPALEAAAQQAVVRGFVSDGDTEVAMQSASVSLSVEGVLRFGTATDGDGYFTINRIPAGRYTLRVSFVGYGPFQQDISLAAGQILEQVITLEPRPEEFEEVTVEAEADAGITSVAAGLEAVTPKSIERVPVPGVSGDLAAYMQTVPGIVVQGDRGGLFFVRGGAVDQNLALIDGLPVYMPFHILSFYSAFPEEIVDQADFYTGGYGARYGTRVSSMIDVSARNGNKRNFAGSISLAPFLSSVRVEGPIFKNRVSFIASARQSLIEEVIPEMFGQKMPYRFGDRFVKVHGLAGGSHSFSATFLDTDDRGDIAGTTKSFTGDAITQAPRDSSDVFWSNTVLGGNWVYRSNSIPLTLRTTAGASRMETGIGGSLSGRSSEIRSVDARMDVTWKFNGMDLNAGALYRTSTLSYELQGLFDGYQSSEDDLAEITAYLETDWHAGRLRFTPGVHLYSLPARGDQWFDPRIRLSYQVANKHQIHGSWGVYHQAVTGLTDERDLGNLFTAWLPVDRNTAVPASMHGIVGWNARLAPWLSAAVEGYVKTYDNLAVPILSVFPRFTTTLQEADGLAYGADIRLDLEDRPFWFDSSLDGYVSFAYSDVEYETSTDTYNPPHHRPAQLNTLFTARKGQIGVTVQWQYGSGLPFTPSSGFDQWYVLTPGVDVASEVGETRILYGDAYSKRQPKYSRVDVWIDRRIETGRYVTTIRAGAVNVLNRDNLFYFDLFTFQRVDHLPLIPSVGIKMELR